MSKPVAIVTGAASGIGLAISKHLLSRGYRVVMGDINSAAGSREAESLGSDALFVAADVSIYSDQAALFRKGFEWGGRRLDFLAANAGIDDRQSLFQKDHPLDEDGNPLPLNLKTIEVDLEAVIQGMWLFRYYRKLNPVSPTAKVVITSSAAGIYPGTLFPQYTTAKHGLIGLTRASAPNLLTEGITVNALCPGVIETNLMPVHVRHLFPRELLTPMSTALRTVDAFLDDDSMTGQTVEFCLDELYFRKQPDYAMQNQKDVAALDSTFWTEAYKSNLD
ncbi:hypothetical protein GQ53DRAFT_793584 [Thozetella sp. PMI_491]|nr:hypothetical protein GQ53DRAFT_793584 [Thozetella sp. PMI_491]